MAAKGDVVSVTKRGRSHPTCRGGASGGWEVEGSRRQGVGAGQQPERNCEWGGQPECRTGEGEAGGPPPLSHATHCPSGRFTPDRHGQGHESLCEHASKRHAHKVRQPSRIDKVRGAQTNLDRSAGRPAHPTQLTPIAHSFPQSMQLASTAASQAKRNRRSGTRHSQSCLDVATPGSCAHDADAVHVAGAHPPHIP